MDKFTPSGFLLCFLLSRTSALADKAINSVYFYFSPLYLRFCFLIFRSFVVRGRTI